MEAKDTVIKDFTSILDKYAQIDMSCMAYGTDRPPIEDMLSDLVREQAEISFHAGVKVGYSAGIVDGQFTNHKRHGKKMTKQSSPYSLPSDAYDKYFTPPQEEGETKEPTGAEIKELYHQPFTVGGTITETPDIVTSPTVRWRDAKIKGDFSCPDCGQVMIVIPTPGMAYAFCPKCMRYFVEVKGE